MNARFATRKAGLPGGCARDGRKRRSNAPQEFELHEADSRKGPQVDTCAGGTVDGIGDGLVIGVWTQRGVSGCCVRVVGQ